MSTPAPDAAAATAALQLDYLPVDELAAKPPAFWQQVLGVIGFNHPPELHGQSVPVSASMTPALAPSARLCEVASRAESALVDDAFEGAYSVSILR